MPLTHYDANGNKVAYAPGETNTGQYNAYNTQYAAPAKTYGSTDFGNLGKQSTPLGYPAEQENWTQTQPASDAATGQLQLAPALQTNTTASHNNAGFSQNPLYGQLSGSLASMYQGQNGLQNGPQNAFDRSTMQNLSAQALGGLNTANRQTMAGYANSQAGRGVVGNSIGGIVGNSLGVQNAGAVANAGFNAYLQGKTQGTADYNARSGAANQIGNLVNSQDQRTFQGQDEQFKNSSDERQNAFNTYTAANAALNNFQQQYAIPLSGTSGSSSVGDQTKTYMRMMFDDLKRRANLAWQNYNQYGNMNNPTQAQMPVAA